MKHLALSGWFGVGLLLAVVGCGPQPQAAPIEKVAAVKPDSVQKSEPKPETKPVEAVPAADATKVETELREKAFRAIAKSIVKDAELEFAKLTQEVDASRATAVGLRLKEQCDNVPEIRYDTKLSDILDRLNLIHRGFSVIGRLKVQADKTNSAAQKQTFQTDINATIDVIASTIEEVTAMLDAPK